MSKLESYQSFVEKYVVDAQNQKLAAVKEAELKTEQKILERLEKQFRASGTPPANAGAGSREATAAPEAVVVAEETVSHKQSRGWWWS